MKKFLWMGMLAFACQATAQNYLIEGTATGMDGQKVYIGEAKSSKDIQMIDSTTVSGGAFRLENKLPAVKQMYLFVGKSKQLFLLEENPVKAVCTTEKQDFNGVALPMQKIRISGSKDQQLLVKMNNTLAQEMMTMMAISFIGKGKDVNAPENKALADSITYMFTTAKQHTKSVFDSIVDNNTDSYVSALILKDFYAKELPAAEIQKRYATLSDRVKKSTLGQELEKTIEGMLAIGVGQTAPDFTLNDPEGKPLKLSSLRGKCVLIDFWASWCGPCLREAPNIRKVYEKYHDKGFEVLSVSIDEKKDAWVKAIEKHQLNWLHVSSLQGWKCPVAKLYQVSGVPAMFLLDKDGKIVSTNARGEALEQEVSKLCK